MQESLVAHDWKIYHLVQPYFFAHQHFHERKVQALKKSGLEARILSFVPKAIYQKNIKRYEELEKNTLIEVKLIPTGRVHSIYLFLFILLKLIKGEKLLIHSLRVKPTSIILLRLFPFLNSRLRYVQEYEGDKASEFAYAREYQEVPRPSEKPVKLKNKLKYYYYLFIDGIYVKCADGLVLMSKEHAELWEKRLNRKLNTTFLPTVPDFNSIRFSNEYRSEIRSDLELKNNLVLVYVGNIVSPWQRLDAMCKFVSELSNYQYDIKFLTLVRTDDIYLMNQTAKKYGIENITIVNTVGHKDVYKYLSAADIALFLRHDHSMNRVVTSAKLGEYLAAGLSIITTGSNAGFLNNLIKELGAGFFVHDDVSINDELLSFLDDRKIRNNDLEFREKVSQESLKAFSAPVYPIAEYCNFVHKIISVK